MIVHLAVSAPLDRHSLRVRILAIALVPSLSLMILGLGSAVFMGYRGYQAMSESGRYAGLTGKSGDSEEATAAQEFLQALRDERRLTGEVLGDPSVSLTSLRAQWVKSDHAAAVVMRSFVSPLLSATELKKILALRPVVASRSTTLLDAVDSYSALIASVESRRGTALSQVVPDPLVVRQDEINKQLSELTETFDVSDALAFSAFSASGMASDTYNAFVRESGKYQQLLTTLQRELPAEEAGELNRATTGMNGEVVSVVQRAILHASTLQTTGSGNQPKAAESQAGPLPQFETVRLMATLPVSRAEWRSATAWLLASLAALQSQHLTYAAGIARQAGNQQVITALIGSLVLLGFAVVVLVVSLTVSRGLIGRLQRLRADTIELSHRRLPEFVRRLQEGRQVDLATELPALDYGSDEIGQVAEAFGEAQRTAVAAAAHEAETRSGLRTVFMDIAHRSQAIVYRQLKVLDQAERSQEDPDQLDLLFQLDHLATRARRNAENLIVLGGGQAGRHWRNPVSLLQLIRSAISEAEDYTRVMVTSVPEVSVAGAVVADLIHLLAELVDNAIRFSPPQSRVEVRGNLVGRGLAIEIDDQGLGVEPDRVEQLNQMLHHPPDFQVMALAEEPRLGLFVVARLAARHGIRVTMTGDQAYGGTRVVVLVPTSMLLLAGDGLSEPDATSRPQVVGLEGQPFTLPLLEAKLTLEQSGSGTGKSPSAAFDESLRSQPRLASPPDMPASSPQKSAPPPRRLIPRKPPVPEHTATTDRPQDRLGTARGQQPLPPSEPQVPPSAVDDRPELPRRVKQTHLSLKLRRNADVPEAAPPTASAVDAETARSRMTALQHGTMRGRNTEPGQPR
jgi:signal transduction histidine kinase